jgi:hypothetical protein
MNKTDSPELDRGRRGYIGPYFSSQQTHVGHGGNLPRATTPYQGHTSHSQTPFSFGDQSSRGHSMGPCGATPSMDDYSLHPQGRMNTYQARHPMGYLADGGNSNSPLSHQHDSTLSQLVTDVKLLAEKATKQDEVIRRLQKSNEELTTRIEAHDKILQELQAEAQPGEKKEKDGSNDHIRCKVSNRLLMYQIIPTCDQALIHMKFAELCGVDRAGKKGERSQALIEIQPLKDKAPFVEVDGNKIWHPVWEGHVDEVPNSLFIQVAAKSVYDNEEMST